jgi:tRNA-dihydrouridine synthase
VGRAVLGAPWFFRPKEQARGLAHGVAGSVGESCDKEVSLDHRFAVLLEHARHFQALCGPNRFYRMRKHLGWYCKGFPHAAALRARMVHVSSVGELESILDDFRAHRIVSSAEAGPVDEADMPASRCG